MGICFFAIKIGLNSFSPTSVASLRLIIASLFLLFFLSKKKILYLPNVFFLLLIIGIIGIYSILFNKLG